MAYYCMHNTLASNNIMDPNLASAILLVPRGVSTLRINLHTASAAILSREYIRSYIH